MASYRRHGSRAHGCIGWPTLPSGPATQVAEAAEADVAATSGAIDWRKERRRRQTATHTAPPGTTETPVVPSPVSATTRKVAGAAASASREAAGLITSQPTAPRHDSGPGIQIGARARCAVPAGHGFRISATIGDVVGEDEQNNDEHQQRLREDAAPRVAASEAEARTERRRDEEAATRSDTGPRTSHLRRSSAGAVAVGDVGVSLRAACGGGGGRVPTAAEVSRRGLVRANLIVRRPRQASGTRQQSSGPLGAQDAPPTEALDSPAGRTGGASKRRGSIRLDQVARSTAPARRCQID